MPVQATMTALSVHSRSGGATSRKPDRPGRVLQRCADCAIRRNTARHDQQVGRGPSVTHHPHRVSGAVGQHFGHGRLKAGCDVGGITHAQRAGRKARHGLRHRGLQAREAERAAFPPQHRPWERVCPWVARFGQPLQRRSAGPAKSEQLGDLVERLSDGIVDGAA